MHRAATIPLTLSWVQLITSRGACPCLSSFLLPPARGCILQRQPRLRVEPLRTNASRVPWDRCLCSPLALEGVCVPGGGPSTRPFQPRFFLIFGGNGLPPSPVTLCHWEPLQAPAEGSPPMVGGHTPHPISICSFTKGCHSCERGTPIPALMCPSQPCPSPPARRGWGGHCSPP